MVENPLDRVATPDVMDGLPDPDFPIADLQNFNPDVTLASGPFVLSTVAGYAIAGDTGLGRLDRLVRERAERAEDGKVNKTDAWYSPIAPPPGVWDYRCRHCRYYHEGGGDGAGGHCAVVGHEEDPFGGERISPEAWCALWLPTEGTKWFRWIKNRAEGGGD